VQYEFEFIGTNCHTNDQQLEGTQADFVPKDESGGGERETHTHTEREREREREVYFGNTQECPDRLRSAPITDALSRGFGIPNRSPDPLVPRAGWDHPFPIFAGTPLSLGKGRRT